MRAAAKRSGPARAWIKLADAVANAERLENPTDVADGVLATLRDALSEGQQGCVTGRRADALFRLADKFYYGRYNGN